MDHLSFFSHAQGQIKAGMKFASGALAAGLPTSPLHGEEAAAEEGLFVKDLGESGTGSSFWVWQVTSGTHGNHLLLSDILIYIRSNGACQPIS
jgi:hypothetical protein